MSTRKFALVFGIIFLLVGIGGFLPGITLMPPHPMHPKMVVDAFYGQELGLFPVNLLHNIVHLLFGAWGLLACKSLAASKAYARGVAIIYAVLTLFGFIPGLSDMFGLLPLFQNDIWLHFLLALVGAYFGWLHRDITPVPPAPTFD